MMNGQHKLSDIVWVISNYPFKMDPFLTSKIMSMTMSFIFAALQTCQMCQFLLNIPQEFKLILYR
jgi:hypothetical protein